MHGTTNTKSIILVVFGLVNLYSLFVNIYFVTGFLRFALAHIVHCYLYRMMGENKQECQGPPPPLFIYFQERNTNN
jgi:hypothetical protein